MTIRNRDLNDRELLERLSEKYYLKMGAEKDAELTEDDLDKLSMSEYFEFIGIVSLLEQIYEQTIKDIFNGKEVKFSDEIM